MADVSGVSSLYGATQDVVRDPTRTLGKDDFLRLLTVQLQHQDPLSPVDNEDFIAQLAQFSSLEQLEDINANLKDGIDLDLILTQVLNNTAAAGLIGKTVIAEGSSVHLDETGSSEIHFDLDSAADHVVIRILDESGVVVEILREDDLAAGRNQVTWDGKDSQGNMRAQGNYTVEIEAYDSQDNQIGATPLLIGEITGVRFENGEARLMVAGLELGIGEIVEILAHADQ
jgi:flagellar basal-body rod modification protein FlgD